MTTPETAPVPQDEEEIRPPSLSLIKSETAPPVEPDEEETGAELEEDEEERAPFMVRFRESTTGQVVIACWEVLDMKGFARDFIGDTVTGSKYVVVQCTEWLFKPDGDDAWKAIGLRSLVFVVPGALLFRAIFILQMKSLMPVVLFLWCLLTWIIGASGMIDSKKRRKAKKKALKKQKKKEKRKREKEAAAIEKDPEPDDDAGEEDEEGPALSPKEEWEQRRETMRVWLVVKIQENPKGKNGIHLDDLYAVALKDGVRAVDTTPDQFRQVLRYWRVPTGQVKIGGSKGDNLTGVKLTDVDPVIKESTPRGK